MQCLKMSQLLLPSLSRHRGGGVPNPRVILEGIWEVFRSLWLTEVVI